MLERCPLSGLCVPCCFIRDLIAIVMSVKETHPQADWLRGIVMTIAYKLLCKS